MHLRSCSRNDDNLPEMMMAATGLNKRSRNSGSASIAAELQSSSAASRKCGAATTYRAGEGARGGVDAHHS